MDTFINNQILKQDFNIIQKLLQSEKYIQLENRTITYLKPSEEINKRISEYIHTKRITSDIKYNLSELGAYADATQTSKTAKDELQEFNIITEYKDISNLIKRYDKITKPKDILIKTAEHKILKYVLTCAIHDPINGDYSNKDNFNLLKEAGNILNDCGGINEMRSCVEYFVKAFIPKRYRREIDISFDNIGGWQA